MTTRISRIVSSRAHLSLAAALAVAAGVAFPGSAGADFTVYASDGLAGSYSHVGQATVIGWEETSNFDGGGFMSAGTSEVTDLDPHPDVTSTGVTTGFADGRISALGTVSSVSGRLFATAVAPLAVDAEGDWESSFCSRSGADVNITNTTVPVHISAVGRGFNAKANVYAGYNRTAVGNGKLVVRDEIDLPRFSVSAGANYAGSTMNNKSTGVLRYEVWETSPASPQAGDVNGNGSVNALDLSLVSYAIGGSKVTGFDVNNDASVTSADVDAILTSLGTVRGDVNLDQKVNFADLVVLGQNYNKPGTWYEGDFDGDGLVVFADQVALAQNYGFGEPPEQRSAMSFAADAASLGLVPEPTTLAAVGGVTVATIRRRR